MTQTMTAARCSAANAMLEEFEHEITKTRRFLERVPDAKLSWKPHDKSMTAGQLAWHIAETHRSVVEYIRTPGGAPPAGDRPQPTHTGAVLAELDAGAHDVRRLLREVDDTWMRSVFVINAPDGSRVEVPRAKFLRAILFNHVYHHRGQLGVYLRLLGLSVPSAYGPSGDEMGGL